MWQQRKESVIDVYRLVTWECIVIQKLYVKYANKIIIPLFMILITKPGGKLLLLHERIKKNQVIPREHTGASNSKETNIPSALANVSIVHENSIHTAFIV